MSTGIDDYYRVIILCDHWAQSTLWYRPPFFHGVQQSWKELFILSQSCVTTCQVISKKIYIYIIFNAGSDPYVLLNIS